MQLKLQSLEEEFKKREDYLLVTLKLYRDCARVQRQRTALALTAIEIEAFTHG